MKRRGNTDPIGLAGLHSVGRSWVPLVEALGPDALADVCSQLGELPELSRCSQSTLTAIGAMVSVALRRRVLLNELENTGWSLAHTGERLRIGYPANVVHEIERLGLVAEYEAAKASGKVKHGGRRKRRLRTGAEGDPE